MKAYITKYALTEGITEHEGEIGGTCKTMFSYRAAKYGFTNYAHGKEWHLTMEDAKKEAYRMKEAKIKSLNKSLERIKALEF
jgi:hypothetical protein